MSEPNILRLKRRRSEDPPDALVLDQARRQHRKVGSEVHYVRQLQAQEYRQRLEQDAKRQRADLRAKDQAATHADIQAKRVFQLNRDKRTGNKRQRNEDDVATFVERTPSKKPRDEREGAATLDDQEVEQYAGASPSKPLKKPTMRTGPVKRNAAPQWSEEQRRHMQAVGQSLQEALQQETQDDPRPARKVVAPKLSGSRSREIHRQRTTQSEVSPPTDIKDVEMTDDGEYVYDTYVLASKSSGDGQDAERLQSVGYLIINEEDQSLWETYFEDDEEAHGQTNTDDEDSNAEDYYGADYPEDELASDDEHDRGAYGYRGYGAPDDEEWEEDTGAYSDEEYGRMMQPFSSMKVPKHIQKFMTGEE